MSKNWIGKGLIALVFSIFFIGCDMEPDTKTYTVYINIFTFSSSHSTFGSLQDGYFLREQLSQIDFNWEKSNNFKNSSPNIWTEDQIYSFLIGWGFSNNQARNESSWLASVNHGLIASRVGEYLYIILK